MGGEFAFLYKGGGMVSHPGCFPGEYADRVALGGDDHVGVAMQDHEPAHVAHRALKPRVLATADHQRIQSFFCHGRAHVSVTPIYLGPAGAKTVYIISHQSLPHQ